MASHCWFYFCIVGALQALTGMCLCVWMCVFGVKEWNFPFVYHQMMRGNDALVCLSLYIAPCGQKDKFKGPPQCFIFLL